MKKMIAIVLIMSMFMSFCACRNETQTGEDEELSSLEMELNTLLSLEDFIVSNRFVMSALLELKDSDIEEAKEYFTQAEKQIRLAQEKTKAYISSPNFVEDDIEELLVNYRATIEILNKGFNMSEEENEKLMELIIEGTSIQKRLMESVQSFSNLYTIRRFDKLPEEESNEKLEESWEDFRFEENVECPKTIDKQELYLIWAEQFSKKDFRQEEVFINELEDLRENDNLASKDYNRKWAEFLEKFIFNSSSTETWVENSTLFLYTNLFLDKHI